ncbi:MAG: hypothetical protein IJU25_03635, partial [Lachnospiraceae bacterium]|nr:hypothetical protein [Lachnospiraceae bacterium]
SDNKLPADSSLAVKLKELRYGYASPELNPSKGTSSTGTSTTDEMPTIDQALEWLDVTEHREALIDYIVTLDSAPVTVTKEGGKGRITMSDAAVLKAVLDPWDLIAMAYGYTMTVKLQFDEWTPNEEEQKAIASLKLPKESLSFFAAKMRLESTLAEESRDLDEFVDPIEFTFDIPQDIRRSGRSFWLLMSHRDEELLAFADKDTDDGTFTFKTNKMCKMAFAYSDPSSSYSGGSSSSGGTNGVVSVGGSLSGGTGSAAGIAANSVTLADANGVLPAGAKMMVTPVLSGAAFDKAKTALAGILAANGRLAVAQLDLLDAAGAALHQLNGDVAISIALPFTPASGNTIQAYRIEDDGTATKLPTTIKDGTLTFTTNHFSVYAFAEVPAVSATDASGAQAANGKSSQASETAPKMSDPTDRYVSKRNNMDCYVIIAMFLLAFVLFTTELVHMKADR